MNTISLQAAPKKKKKKKSDLSSKHSYDMQVKLLSRAKDVFGTARACFYSHSKIIELLGSNVYKSKEWLQVPAHVQSYVSGYIAAEYDAMYRNCLEWRLFIDGKLMSREEYRALDTQEKLANPNAYASFNYVSVYRRADSDKSHHTYIGRPDKIY